MNRVKSPFILTPILYHNLKCTKDVIVHQGGTSSGKTYTNLQTMIIKAIQEPRSRNIVVGQDIPNLKSGSIADMENILFEIKDKIPKEYKHIFKTDYNKTDKMHHFFNGSYLKFMSYDDAQDAKNGKNDNTFFNEANGVSWEIYDARAIRTERQVILDFNADAPFWAHERLRDPHTQWYITNYLHNPFLDEKIRRKIESRQDDKEWWRVYGLGLTGQSEGIIFKNVKWLKKGSALPAECTRRSYGIDFGYTNDPTTIVETGYYNGHIYGRLLLHEHSLTNPDIANKMLHLDIPRNAQIFADSSEPKSIAEINSFLRKKGVYYKVQAAAKGQDSVRHGIELLKQHPMLLVDCIEWQKEHLNYKWDKRKTDRKGRKKPVDAFNHIWDAMRYARQGLQQKPKNGLSGFGKAG